MKTGRIVLAKILAYWYMETGRIVVAKILACWYKKTGRIVVAKILAWPPAILHVFKCFFSFFAIVIFI